jgi:hypothetical protein
MVRYRTKNVVTIDRLTLSPADAATCAEPPGGETAVVHWRELQPSWIIIWTKVHNINIIDFITICGLLKFVLIGGPTGAAHQMSADMRNTKRRCAALLFLLLAAPPLLSSEGSVPVPVLVSIISPADEASVDEQFAELLLERSLSAIRAAPGLDSRSEDLIQDAVLQQIPLAIAMQIRLDSGRIVVNASLFDATDRELVMALEATGPVELGMSSKLRFIADQFAAEAAARGIEYPEPTPDPVRDPARESEDASSSPSVATPQAGGDASGRTIDTAPVVTVSPASDTTPDFRPEVTLVAPTAPDGHGAAPFDDGPILPALPAGAPPVEIPVEAQPASTDIFVGVEHRTFPATTPAAEASEAITRDRVGVRIMTVDAAPTASVPIGRYADLVRYELGARARAAITFGERSWILAGLSVGWGYIFEENPYVDRMTSLDATLETGLRAILGEGPLVVSPIISGGIVVHFVSGEFNTLADTSDVTYVDQLYSFRLELSFEPWLVRPSLIGAFIAPTVNVFPNQTTGGFSIGVNAGIRLNPGASAR